MTKEIVLNEEEIIKIIAEKFNIEPKLVDLYIKEREIGFEMHPTIERVVRAKITQECDLED